jgi:hypothetical protein
MDNDENHEGYHKMLLAFGLPYDMANTKKRKELSTRMQFYRVLCVCVVLKH